MATDMFNTVNDDVFDEFNKAQLRSTPGSTTGGTDNQFDFGSFVDAVALLNLKISKTSRSLPSPVPGRWRTLRKTLKDDLKYVRASSELGTWAPWAA